MSAMRWSAGTTRLVHRGRGAAKLLGVALLSAIPSSPARALTLSTLPSNTWVEAHPTYEGVTDGVLCPQAWNNKGVYDPASQRVIAFDRWCDSVHSGSIYANALLAFDPVAETVTVLKIDNWHVIEHPSSYSTEPLPAYDTEPTPVDRHPLGDLALAPDYDQVFLANGLNQSVGPAFCSEGRCAPWGVADSWSFDLGSLVWSKVGDVEAGPHPANYGVMTYDPAARLVVMLTAIYGGTAAWLLDPETRQWRIASDATPSPAGIQGAGVAYDTLRQRVVVFGRSWEAAYASPELWSYSVAQNAWTRLADCPMAGYAPGFDYDSNHDVFLALIATSTWIYDPTVDAWSEVQTPMPRIADMGAQPVVYDAAHDVFVFEGGNSGYAPAQWIVFRYSGAPAAPTITQQPVSKTVHAGETATFTVYASGLPPPSYRWQIREPGASSFVDVSGAVTASLVRAEAPVGDSGAAFRCVVANAQGSVTSDAATLTVLPSTSDTPAPPAALVATAH